MDEQRFAAWMKALDRPSSAALPDAGAVWWRAELRRRLAAEERAIRPIRLAEQFACGVCVMAAAVLAAMLTWARS